METIAHTFSTEEKFLPDRQAGLPPWFRQPIPNMNKIRQMKEMFRQGRLHTVCESAHCPNLGTCWGAGVATFMILGGACTRACRFCAVPAGKPMPVDAEESYHVAEAVKALNLRFVVVTSVARDDLEDEGAEHFSRTIQAIREINPLTKIEILISDFSNKWESLKTVIAARPEVISHNIETVRRLSPLVRPQADYERSLEVLKTLKELSPAIFTKSGVMVGLGESDEEIVEVMKDLVNVGCDILTIGQYLSPSQARRHLAVQRFVPPEKFDFYREVGLSLGFKHVMSGPLVRSSFLAEEGYEECLNSVTRDSSLVPSR